MARPKNTNNTNTQTNTETTIKPANKKVKVIFKNPVISDYGDFKVNQVAELEEKIANKMIKGGYAVIC